jgi:hypothetical protein
MNWISVEDRLPEKADRYLVALEFDGAIVVDFDDYEEFREGWDWLRYYDIEPPITHWMPLPEPPESENE